MRRDWRAPPPRAGGRRGGGGRGRGGRRPQVAAIQARLESVRGRRDALGGGLLPPLAGFASEVDRRLPRLEEMVTKYRSGDAVAAGLLGYQGARPYLVLGQDNTEVMPGGGLIGVYGLVTLEDGALIESRLP